MADACVAVDARTGPQVTLEGIRLIGRKPSELAKEIGWGMYPRPQRVGDLAQNSPASHAALDWRSASLQHELCEIDRG